MANAPTAVTLLVLSTVISWSPTPATGQAPPAPPNIVVILTDDMRADQLDDMPVVQRELVGRGRSFDRAFIVDPVCCPSRVSFLRGQSARTTSVFDIDGPWGGWGQVQRAGLEASTLATWLSPTHYTALVGKYMNGYNAASYIPPGWDRWRAMMKTGYPGWHVEHVDAGTPHRANGIQLHPAYRRVGRGDRGLG